MNVIQGYVPSIKFVEYSCIGFVIDMYMYKNVLYHRHCYNPNAPPTCSMDGFRVVRLEDVLPHLDILISATGKCLSLTVMYM